MILLDYKDSRPIYEQVVGKLSELMILGVLEEDSQMPSVRSLATDLSINPNTIQRAYGELERRGFIYSVKGRGSFVGSIHKLRESARADLVKRLGLLAKEARNLGMKREEFVDAAGGGYDQAVENESGAVAAGRSRQEAPETKETSGQSQRNAAGIEGVESIAKARETSGVWGEPEADPPAAGSQDKDKGGRTV